MKIFLFCIMITASDNQLIYQYKESFASRFECERQAYFEAEKNGAGDNKSSNYYCGTSEQFVKKYIKNSPSS